MTEIDANERLINKHNDYFDNSSGSRITRYAAVIKLSNDDSIVDDYVIEIAYNKGQNEIDYKIDSSNFSRNKGFLQELNIPENIKEEIEKDKAVIVNTDKISYQNNPYTCNFQCTDACKGFCEDIYEKSTKKYEKLTAGISVFDKISTQSYGTAGAFFKTTMDNSIYMLSNFHVLLGQSTNESNLIVQPSIADMNSDCSDKIDVIGEVYWKKEISDDCFNLMDAAVAKIYEKIKVDVSKYTRCRHLKFTGIEQPKLGQNVRKCGRTTGLTTGEIRSINCTVNVSNELKTQNIYRNQILTTLMTQPGDSGSVLVNDNNKIVGLLFAGNQTSISVANNIITVFDHIKKDKPNFQLKKFV